MKTFARSWLSKVVVLGVVAALLLMGAPVYADATPVTGNVTANNNIPENLGLTLKVHGGTETDAMTPLTEYDLDIAVTDDNTLADIAQIDIVIFYDASAGDDGTPAGAWDCDEEAIYKWVDDSGGTWSIEKGAATTTWTLENTDCVEPTMSNTTGTWTLAFEPGKLAVESDGSTSEWDIKVTVTDLSDGSANTTIYSKSMAAYSSISTDVGSITFGSGVNLGATAYIDTPADHNFATQVLANDTYALKVNTAATWSKGSDTITLDTSGTPDAAGEFGLNIDDAGDGSGAPTTPQAVTTTATEITGHSTDARVTTTAGASEATANQNFYMSLELYSSGIPSGAYSGDITFTVVNN
jgi:hypothetical protein